MKKIKEIFKIFIVLNVFFLCLQIVNADLEPTIHSTESGGNWNSVSSWIEGKTPVEGDTVEINGPIEITENLTLTGNIEVTKSGSLNKNGISTWYNIKLNGDIINNGHIGKIKELLYY